jgi:hypothetical protein
MLKTRFFLLKCCWPKCKTYGYWPMCLFGPKGEEVRGGWMRLRCQGLYDPHSGGWG